MVSGTNQDWLLPPDGAVSIRVAYFLPLPVSIVVEEDTDNTECKDEEGKGESEVVGVVCEVESCTGVY